MKVTNKKQTSPRVVKIASKVLKSKTENKKDKSLAGSALSQARPKKKGK